MKKFDIYYEDLNADKQKAFLDFMGGDIGNHDVFPIATIVFDDEMEENNDGCI